MTGESVSEEGVLLRPKNPKISEYKSKRRDSLPGGQISKSPVSARQRGMDDLEDDGDDVVFK